jgi:hypothetical protein
VQRQELIIIIIIIAIIITGTTHDTRVPGDLLPGAAGTCVLKSAAIPARSTILRDRGLTMV